MHVLVKNPKLKNLPKYSHVTIQILGKYIQKKMLWSHTHTLPILAENDNDMALKSYFLLNFITMKSIKYISALRMFSGHKKTKQPDNTFYEKLNRF